jgi:hypothetical protein
MHFFSWLFSSMEMNYPAASGGEPSARRIRKNPTRDFLIDDHQRAFYGPIKTTGVFRLKI